MKTRSERLDHLQEHFFAGLEENIGRLKAQGRDIYRLDIGSPDLPPAEHILAALHHSADQPDHHGYQPLRGAPALHQAWASHYRQHYAVDLDADGQVLPLIGSKEGIFVLTQAVCDPGDTVLVPDPAYPIYAQAARYAGAEPYFIPLLAENGWLPDLGAVPAEALKRARLLWLSYPNNPTTAIASPEFFAQAVAFARQHDLLLCHDAAYSLVVFDRTQPISLLQISGAAEVAVEFNTLSKAYNMAGWRIGAAVGNPHALQSLYSILAVMTSGSFRPANEGAIAAVTGDQGWIVARNAVYQRRRDLVLRVLHDLGWQAEKPLASLYVWFRIPPDYSTSVDFCQAVLEQTGVSLTPGSIFGAQGEGYARLSFTLPDEILQEALARLSLL
jgi:LL-diaminopimelate aminotransferase